MIAELVGEENTYSNYISHVKKEQLKQQVDDWLVRYDKLLTKFAIIAAKVTGKPEDWEDYKSEMVLQAYDAAMRRYDEAHGVSLSSFLCATLKRYCFRGDIQKKVKSNTQVDDEDTLLDFIRDNEVSSLERSHGVFSLLNSLHEGERMLMKLHYEVGLTPKQIDDLMCVSHSTTWHRIQSILLRLQTTIKDVG